MINIEQDNKVRDQQIPEINERKIQTSLDDQINELIPDVQYTCNSIQANVNPSYTPTINPIQSSSQTSIFNLPSGVYNHSKTLLSFTIGLGTNAQPMAADATQTANNVVSVNNFYFPFIQSLEFYTQAGTRLCSINAVDKLNRLSGILNLKISQTPARGFMVPSQRNYNSITTGNAFPANTIYHTQTPDPFFTQNNGGLSLADPPVSIFASQSLIDPSVQYIPYTQGNPSNFGSGKDLVIGGNGNAIPTFYEISFRIGDLLPDSIFNVRKDLYFAKISYIKVTFNSIDQIGNFVTLDSLVATPYTLKANRLTSSATLFMGIVNMELSVFTQTNQKICDAIIESQKDQSVPVVVPFVQYSSQSFSQGTSQNCSFKISTENSVSTLYKAYYGVFQQDSAGVLSDSSSNINEYLWSSTIVKLNNTVIRSYIDLAKKQDITEMAEFFPNNSITSYRAIRYAGVYGLVFDTEPCKPNYNGSDIQGLELKPSNDLLMNFTTTTSGAGGQLTHFLFNVQNRVFFAKNGEYYTIKQL